MSDKPKRTRKSPVEKVTCTVRVGVKFPAKDCYGNECKAELENGVIKFYESDGDQIGGGVRLDVLKAVIEKLSS